jgi:7-keto-8-aminopelargonate synthetase-like enzyme
MDGDYPDLPKFIEVKKRHDALLYVDEAHSLGTMGPGGRGICDFFGCDPAEGDLWMGTISKALGAGGGYLAGRERLDPLPRLHHAGVRVFDRLFAAQRRRGARRASGDPARTVAGDAAPRAFGAVPQARARLRPRHRVERDTPVIPIIVGSSTRAIQVSQLLLERGINARPILYPGRPRVGGPGAILPHRRAHRRADRAGGGDPGRGDGDHRLVARLQTRGASREPLKPEASAGRSGRLRPADGPPV